MMCTSAERETKSARVKVIVFFAAEPCPRKLLAPNWCTSAASFSYFPFTKNTLPLFQVTNTLSISGSATNTLSIRSLFCLCFFIFFFSLSLSSQPHFVGGYGMSTNSLSYYDAAEDEWEWGGSSSWVMKIMRAGLKPTNTCLLLLLLLHKHHHPLLEIKVKFKTKQNKTLSQAFLTWLHSPLRCLHIKERYREKRALAVVRFKALLPSSGIRFLRFCLFSFQK